MDIVRYCKKPSDFENLLDNEHYVKAFDMNVENKLFEKYTGKKAADLAEAALKAIDKDAEAYLNDLGVIRHPRRSYTFSYAVMHVLFT